jgi:hypothetical protein
MFEKVKETSEVFVLIILACIICAALGMVLGFTFGLYSIIGSVLIGAGAAAVVVWVI